MNPRILRTIAAALPVLGIAASARAQVSFQSFVAVGDSLAAGVSSASLVETHQRRSVPALIARQAGAPSFEQPLMTEPGVQPELHLVTLFPVPIITRKANVSGSPANFNLPRSYNNMAVPGATSIDVLTRVTDGGAFHDLILRGRGTQLQQAGSLAPTTVLVWVGNNDVLGAAVRGQAIDGVTLTPTATFRVVYGQIVGALRSTGARLVAANLPDVTSIPYVTTIAPVVVDPTTGQPVTVGGQPVALIGPQGPIASNTLVTLAASTLLAQGIGIPTALGGKGTPLPDEVLLDPNEQAIIRDHVAANNQSIRDICSAAGIGVVDVNGLLNEVAAGGREVGGIRLTSDFLSGGVFSYDGIHPTELGYALVANEFIDTLNADGANVPRVDLGPFLFGTQARRGEVRAASKRYKPFEFTQRAWDSLLAMFPPVSRN
jgi:lysophospholipase L1-like esterase